MRSPALFIAALVAVASPAVAQTLSWNDAFRREDALKQALEEAKTLQAQLDLATQPAPSTPKDTAQAKLGHALLAHPEMTLHNRALIGARQALQTATASGDATITASARTHLAAVQTARYNKAASIPELKKLIDAWKVATAKSTDPKPVGKPAAKPTAKQPKPKPKPKLTLEDLQV